MNQIRYALFDTVTGEVLQLGEVFSEANFIDLKQDLPDGISAFEYTDREVSLGMIYDSKTGKLLPRPPIEEDVPMFGLDVPSYEIKENLLIIMQALAELYERDGG